MIYPQEILEREVKRYKKDYINEDRAFGELGHPDGPTINLERVSHMITNLRKSGTDWVGKAKVMRTPPNVKIVEGLLNEGAKLGVSSRGMGSLQEQPNGTKMVKDDYFLATNEHTLRMSGAQYLWRYMHESVIPDKYLKVNIAPLELWMGKKAAWGMFRVLIQRNISPASICTVMGFYRRYTGQNTQVQMKKVAHYMLNVESIMKTKHSMYNFIPKAQLVKCVNGGKKLQPLYVNPGNLGLPAKAQILKQTAKA